jgi:hypothetical protein
MAKKKSPPDIDDVDLPAELPETEPSSEPSDEPLPDVLDDPEGTPPSAPVEAAPEWAPPANCIVSDDPEGTRLYKIRVGGHYYRHVSDAPDGRWVYELDL